MAFFIEQHSSTIHWLYVSLKVQTQLFSRYKILNKRTQTVFLQFKLCLFAEVCCNRALWSPPGESTGTRWLTSLDWMELLSPSKGKQPTSIPTHFSYFKEFGTEILKLLIIFAWKILLWSEMGTILILKSKSWF